MGRANFVRATFVDLFVEFQGKWELLNKMYIGATLQEPPTGFQIYLILI